MGHIKFDSPWGPLALTSEQGFLVSLSFLDFSEGFNIRHQECEVLSEAERQILAYCDGRLKIFDLPLRPKGTDFQQMVWQRMLEIPFGEVSTYGEIAEVIKRPKASRAVGGAANKNPIPLIIPCHRVIGQGNKLTGFALGLDLKSKLLKHENHSLL